MRHKSEAGFTVTELLVVAAILGLALAAVVGIYQVTQQSTLYATAGEDAQMVTRAVLDRLIADFQLINAGRTAPSGAITAATANSITLIADADNSLDAAGNLMTLNAQADTGASSVTLTPPAAGTNLGTLFPCGIPLTLADGPIMESHPLASSNCVSGNTLSLATGEQLLTWYPAGSLVRSVETVSYTWDSGTGTLCRNVGAACTAPFPDAQIIATGVTSFQLTYLDSAGTPISAATLATQTGRDSIRAISAQVSVRSQSGNQVVSRTMAVTVRPRNF